MGRIYAGSLRLFAVCSGMYHTFQSFCFLRQQAGGYRVLFRAL